MDEQQPEANGAPKKFVMPHRPRIPAETTQGRLFARHIVAKDLSTFAKYVDQGAAVGSADLEALGKLALLNLIVMDDSLDKTPALTEESLALLTPDDVETLAKAIAKACNLQPDSTIKGLRGLGEALQESLSAFAKQLTESADAIKKTIAKSFGTLPKTVTASLGEKFSALSAARNALNATNAVSSAIEAHERNLGLTGRALPEVNLPTHSMPKRVELLNFEAFRPPRFEETAPGRAAARAVTASEESARQLTEVAGLMGTMAEQMAALQTVFLSEVLPEWFRNLEDGGKATTTTLRQAEKSLFWAKWALIASVFVSVAMTGWQVWLAREYKVENDKQQETSETLMRQQLRALQELKKPPVAARSEAAQLNAPATSETPSLSTTPKEHSQKPTKAAP